MAGIDKVRQVVGMRRSSVATLAAGLLLAACSGQPNTSSPQAIAMPAGFSQRPALGALNGLAPEQVTALIGDPDLRRVDPPAEIWQYRSADCVLELYFYDSGTTSRMVYAEAHSRLAEARPAAGVSCSQNLGPLISASRQ